jgi:hypothetical protein
MKVVTGFIRNISSVSLKIRFQEMVSVFRHEMTNDKRGGIPLLPLTSHSGHRRVVIASDVPSRVWLIDDGLADRFSSSIAEVP